MKRDEFERLYADHAQDLFGFLVYRTGDRPLAEDLLADTFERAFAARRRFDPRRARAKTWLYAIATNLLRDRIRRAATEARALERAHAGGTAVAMPEADSADERAALQQALAGLTDEEREAISLRYGGDLSTREAARVAGVKLTTLEGRIARGLRKLRDELA